MTHLNLSYKTNAMKIKPEHLQILADALEKVKEKFPEATLQNYIDNNIGKDHAKRWRRDLFYAAMKLAPDSFTSGVLYSYMDDTHIDTALRYLLLKAWFSPGGIMYLTLRDSPSLLLAAGQVVGECYEHVAQWDCTIVQRIHG